MTDDDAANARSATPNPARESPAGNRRAVWGMAALGAALLVCGIAAVAVLNRTQGGPSDAAGATSDATATEALDALAASLDAAAQYVNADREDEAAKILEAAAEKFPDEPQVLRQLYEVRLHQSRTADAYAIIQDLIATFDRQDAELRFNAGVVANMLGKTDESIVHFQKAAELDPTNPKHPLYLAQMLIKTHEYTQAQTHLLRCIHLDPTIHQAWGTLAEINLIENQLDMAEQNLGRARKLAPEFPKWRLLEAKVLRRRGKPEEAVTLLSALPDRERYTQDVVDEIAQCWALMGSPARAAQEHVNFLNRVPDAWESAVAAARYFLVADDPDRARQWTAYAQRLAPEDAEVKRLVEQLLQ